jgi:hypothetical protein
MKVIHTYQGKMRDNLHMMIIAQKSLIIMAGVTSRMMRNG